MPLGLGGTLGELSNVDDVWSLDLAEFEGPEGPGGPKVMAPCSNRGCQTL